MAHTRMYNPGVITLDLPYTNYFYELQLFSVNDFHGGFSVTLVHNYDAKKDNKNHFNMREGYKLNVQKRLLLSNGVPCQYIDASYKMISLSDKSAPVYTFNDDSQRILRVSNNGEYVVEYPDGAKENFNSNGYITKILDKYGTTVFEYTYDSASKLTSLTYRANQTVSFSYNSIGGLSALTYASYTTSLTYSSSGIEITLFSGEYVRLMSSGYRFISLAGDRSTSGIITSKNMIDISGTLDGEYIISATIKKMVYDADGNATETWSTTYNFPNVNYPSHTYNQVDITDYYGARKRIQYLNDKPQYSYEIGENDVDFISYGTYVYPSNVEILSKDKSTSQNEVVGFQGLYNGTKMSREDNKWCCPVSDIYSSSNGYYMLSGWAKVSVDETGTMYSGADNCKLKIQSLSTVLNSETNLDLTPFNKWKYFSVLIKCNINSIYAFPGEEWDFDLKDLRITKIANESETNYLFTSSDGLMPHRTSNAEHDFFIPLSECTFYFNGKQMAENIYYDDILKYKINKHDDTYPFEFYAEKVTCVFEKGSDDQITVKYTKNGTQKSFNIDDCYIAKRVVTQKNETVYQYLWHDATGPLRFRTVDESGNLLFVQSLDSHFNTEQNTILIGDSGRCIYYERSETGLVTSETVSDIDSNPLYTRTYAYSADTSGNPTLTVTDEFNAQTVYTYDAVWGKPISATLPDGTVVTDVYDNSMRALLGRTVGGTGGRTNQLGYTDGLLSAMQTGALSYSFAYTNDELTGVLRQDESIEEYEHTKYKTSAYYPSKTNKSYGITENYDKYGRLTSVEGVIDNTYGTLSSWSDTSVTETILTPVTTFVNSASVIATSEDLVANETNAYQYYANNKQVAVRTVTSSTDNSAKCIETFTYDNENRLASHTTQYDAPTDFSVKGTVNYVSHISAIDKSSKVGEYNYYINYHINNSPASQTLNSYDLYDRKNEKTVYFSNSHLTVGYVFNKTRVLRLSNTITADGTVTPHTVAYSYDPLGRIFIESVIGKDRSTFYTYDAYGQLVREDNATYGNTFTYSYDTYGNIVQAKRYSYNLGSLEGENATTFSYTYGATAKDRLTSYNGNTISYNTYGYVSSYKGAAYSWNKGRLASIQKGNPRLTTGDYEYCGFTYNGYGQRTAKKYIYNSNTVILGSPYPTYNTKYWYDGSGRLIREYCTETFKGETTTNTYELIYLYDDEGMVGVRYSYNGATPQNYFYVRNLHGDVVAIYSENGIKQAEYAYDAYGNCKVTNSTNYNLAHYNPIRYRGYYYDRETGLYYLNARYYNPEWRRFISHDLSAYLNPESVNGLNLYCYCGNNPVMGYDPNGTFDWNEFWKTALGVTAAVGLAALAIGATIVTGGSFGLLVAGFAMGATASVVGQGISNMLSGEGFFDGISLGSIIMGGLAGAAFITGLGGFWGAVAIGAVSNAGTSALEKKSWANIGASAIIGGVAAGVGFGLGRFVSNHVFRNSGMGFIDYFELGIIDTNAILGAGHAFIASWHAFLPSVVTSASRGATKALGSLGIRGF